jgi:hypothetical protein
MLALESASSFFLGQHQYGGGPSGPFDENGPANPAAYPPNNREFCSMSVPSIRHESQESRCPSLPEDGSCGTRCGLFFWKIPSIGSFFFFFFFFESVP